jgi:uncharacterized protein
MQSALLAFSGGVDSTFLLKALQMSGIETLAVTSSSEIIPSYEVSSAECIAKELGIKHRILETEKLLTREFVNNSAERCFFCKTALFRSLTEISLSKGYRFILDGSNRDDLMDFRPGQKALSAFDVRSPLIEAGFTKGEIRECSRQLGLPTWDRPSSPCLATRIPYGRRITKEALKRIELSEGFLRSLGFRQIRVRDHGSVARIELGEGEIELALGPERRKVISETFKSLGYEFVSLDLDGYKSGSMNRILNGGRPWKTVNI